MAEVVSFRSVVTARHLQVYETFVSLFERTARELAADTGETALSTVSVSRRQLDRWLSGELKSIPRPRQCRILEAMLGHSVHDLFASEPAILRRPVDTTDDLRSQLDKAAELAVQAAKNAESQEIGSVALSDLESEAWRLIRLSAAEPTPVFLGRLTTLEAQVSGYVALSRNPETLRRLYRMAGIANWILAKQAHYTGSMQTSLRFSRAGLFAAERAQDTVLISWIRCIQSLASFWEGDYRFSVDFADRGLSADDRDSDTRVWLCNLRARSLAYLGEADEALACLDEAIKIRNRLDDLDEEEEFPSLRSMLSFAEELQMAYEASTRIVVAPDDQQTWAVAHESVRLFDFEPNAEGEFCAQAGARVQLAELYVRTDNLAQARSTLSPTFKVEDPNWVNGVTRCMTRLRRQLVSTPSDSIDKSEFLADIDVFLANSTLRLT